jgi:hypothetical protein
VLNNASALTHTNQPGGCLADQILKMAEDCDHEYYMSALGPPMGDKERARRGRVRIEECAKQFEQMRQSVTCKACLTELDRQLELQRKALDEIESAWRQHP